MRCPFRRPANTFRASSRISLICAGAGLEAGKRAKAVNSSTSVFSVPTSRPISLALSPTAASRSGGGDSVLHPLQQPQDALRGKLNGGQRILDFVGDAAGHLLPGRRALRTQDLRQVFQYQDGTHASVPGLHGRDGQRHERAAAPQVDFRSAESPLPGAPPAGTCGQFPARPRRKKDRSVPGRGWARGRPNSRSAVEFKRVIWPCGSKEMTPVGMFSRMASMVLPRSSNWRLAS